MIFETDGLFKQGWHVCDGSRITKGKWEGEKTPDLTRQAFLMGDKADPNKRLNIKQEVREPSEFEGTLDQEERTNKNAGFCHHERNLTTGCSIGSRFKNHVGLRSSKDFSSYLRTFKVVYIIKCW